MEKLISEQLQEAVDLALAKYAEAKFHQEHSITLFAEADKIVDRELYIGNWLSSDKTKVLQCGGKDGTCTIIDLDDPTEEDEDDNE